MAGAYNRDIDKRLARKLVWLRETSYQAETFKFLLLKVFCFEAFVNRSGEQFYEQKYK